jgi:hypothetical protein
MRRLPALDGGYLLACDACGHQQTVPPQATVDGEPPSEDPPASAGTPAVLPPRDPTETIERFRKLTAGGEQTPQEWPEEVLESLPPEARQQLAQRAKKEAARGEQGTVSADWEQHLRSHGYYLDTDHRGTRLSGQGPRPGTGDLSAYDVVRLAADLDGGLPAPESRRKCPHCQAVISMQAANCPWCGKTVSSNAGPTPDETPSNQ